MVHLCVLCGKKRDGRFTRRRGAAGGGWSEGHSLPFWFCYSCLPLGDGRDEDGAVMAPKAVTPTTRVDPQKIQQEGLQLLTPIQAEVVALHVRTAEDYLAADGVLHRIRVARKTWGDRMEKIIRPIRTGLDEVYKLNRDVDRPMEVLESRVKDAMKMFKLAEQRALQAAEDARRAEEDRLRREAEEKRQAAEHATTAQMRDKLTAQAQRAEAQSETAAQEELPEAVHGMSSTTRPLKKVRVTDLTAFLQGIIDGYIPDDYVAIIQSKLNTALREDPEGMKAWPGVEVYDDVQIVGR